MAVVAAPRGARWLSGAKSNLCQRRTATERRRAPCRPSNPQVPLMGLAWPRFGKAPFVYPPPPHTHTHTHTTHTSHTHIHTHVTHTHTHSHTHTYTHTHTHTYTHTQTHTHKHTHTHTLVPCTLTHALDSQLTSSIHNDCIIRWWCLNSSERPIGAEAAGITGHEPTRASGGMNGKSAGS